MKIKNLKSIALLLLCTMLNINYAWGDTSTLDFTEACGGSGTADDGAEWEVKSDGSESNFDATHGIHYGTNSASVTWLQLSTSDISGTITEVVVRCRDARAAATISVSVGGDDFTCEESTTATNSSADYTFTGSGSGKIVVLIDRGSSQTKALYCKTITVTYSSGGGDGYSITYNCDGATSGCPSDASGQTALPDPLPSAPTKTDYTFAGWYTNAEKTDAAVAGATISSNTTLYAKWTYAVTLHYKGTTAVISGQTGTYTLPTTGTYVENACDAWKFHCWANASYTNSTTAPSSTKITEVTGPCDVYAVYKNTEDGDEATFTGVSSGGWTTTADSQTGTKGTSPTFTIATSSGLADTGSDHLRVYKNQTFTVSVSSGNITSISMTGVSGNPVSNFGSPSGLSTSGNDGEWTGSANSVTFTASVAQVRMSEVVVRTGTAYYRSDAQCNPTAQIVGTPWVTSTKDETVKIEVPVSATNFDANCTLSDPTVSGAGFAFVGWGAGGNSVTADTELETSIILSYTPSAYGTSTVPTNTATVTLGSNYSGSKTPSYPAGTVNGRSLPQEFLIIAKTNNDGKWWAVPSNMPTTSNTFAGVEVVPDNTTTPTVVPAGPASALYGLTAVHTSNYADYGQYVRFFSKGTNRMLWATSSSGAGIKNDALYTGSSTSHQYEWKASTTDGRAYTLTNVGNENADRALKYYTGDSKFGYYDNGQSTLYIVPVNCDTRATIKSKDSTYNSITLEWEGASGQNYNLYVKYSGAVEKTELLVSSPVTVSGLAHDNSEYTYVLTPGGVDDDCRLEGTIHTKIAPINVTLSCNGEATDLGSQDNPYVLPTTGSYVADACDDWKFAGWYGSTYGVPTASSSAPDYITQLEATGTAYAVYQHTDGAGGSENLTITGSQSSGGGYETDYSVTETTSGGDDITIESNNLLKNTGSIQLKSGTANRIYNTTPMPGDITEITVTATTNSAYVYVGSSSVGSGSTELTPTSGSVSGTATYTIPEGKTYFAVGATGSYVVVSSIVVSYSSSSTTYSTTTDCCDEVEKPEVTVATRTTGATLSWQKQVSATNGYSVTIAEDPTKNADFGTNVTSYVIEGLDETAKYTYTVTAKGPTCDLSTSGEFATDTFKISIAEWDTCGVYLDLGDMMGATAVLENQDTQAEHVKNYADSLFFSKYFEAASNTKLLAIFNGTDHAIDLSSYKLAIAQASTTFTQYPFTGMQYKKNGSTYYFSSEQLLLGSGKEIILISYPDENASDAAIIQCAQDNENSGFESYYRLVSMPHLEFNGDDPIGLVNPEGNFIDLIGAGTLAGGADLDEIDPCSASGASGGTYHGFMDKPGGWYNTKGYHAEDDNTETNNYALSSNRCLLIRRNHVKNGLTAVARNTEDFVTLGDYTYLGDDYEGEWKGVQIPGGGCNDGNCDGVRSACAGFDKVGSYDYNEYYAKYDTITKDLSLDDKRQPDGTYYIHITGLSEKSCTNLRITVKDASDKTINGTWKVPIFVTNDGGALSDGNVATTDVVFTKEGEDCAQCDVVIMRNANLSVATGGKNTVRNVEVYHSGQLNIPADQSFNIQRLIMRSKEDTVPRADMRGALNQNETTFAFDKRIKAGRWYKIALPYRCKISDVTFRNGELAHYNTDWYLQTYDGDNRANGIQTGNWHIYTGEYMEPGVGYNLAIDEGILDEGNHYAELRFPMTANAEFAENATVPVGVNAWGANNSRTKGGDPVTPNHLGWNMIGNPYMLDYTTGSVTTPLTIGKLEPDGITWTLNNNGLRYVVALKSTRDSYEQIAIGAGKKEMEPFMAYFVQIDGSTDREALNITFAKGQQHGRSIVRRNRAQYEEEDNTPVWCAVNITNPLNEKDETTLLISDDFTEDYDMMNDFTKMRGDKYKEYSKPVLASRNTTGDMAFNAVPDSTAAKGVPLTFYTNQAGQFTFRMDFTYGLDKIQRVEIYDDNDKQWHSLMNGDEYSFYSDHLGDNTDRFRMRVVVDRKAPHITTDLEPTESENSAPSKLLINGHVYIFRGGRIYDITGKQLR